MVEKQRDSDRLHKDEDETGAPEADPTLDIVRQMIDAAEAVPAPAQRPRGPATPRPGAETAPPPAGGPTVITVPADQPAPATAPVPDALSEDWDDDWDNDSDEILDDDDWEDLSSDQVTRAYRIVDPHTGEIVGEAGVSADAAQGKRASREGSVLGRLVSGAVRGMSRLVYALLSRLIGLLWRWARAAFIAISRRVARFMRRPDAARRLAIAIIVFSIFVWPVKVLWLTLLIPLAALITWASVGNEGCVELVINWHARLKARDAAKAERIRSRAAAVTQWLNRRLERLPQSWTQGLYLPDFETDGYVPEKLKVDPFEELAARVHSAKSTGSP